MVRALLVFALRLSHASGDHCATVSKSIEVELWEIPEDDSDILTAIAGWIACLPAASQSPSRPAESCHNRAAVLRFPVVFSVVIVELCYGDGGW